MTGNGRLLLAVDTATKSAVVALGDGRDAPLSRHDWVVGHRHGETLLPRIESALREAGRDVRDLTGIVVGVGPGSFTGLRVGMTVAKTLAYGLGIPIAGVGTLEALAAAAGVSSNVAVALPAGPSDRYVAQYRVSQDGHTAVLAPPRLVPPDAPLAETGDVLVAIDMDDADSAARERGASAVARLGELLLRLGAARLDAGDADDAAELVPAYVTLPRGLSPALAESAWSPDLR